MPITFGRVLALLIAIAYVLVAIARGGLTTGVEIGLFLLLPLALIWFPDEIGSYKGVGRLYRYGRIDQESPPISVSVMGWLLLVGLPLLLAYIWR
jgi:hypothetical protein